MPVFSAPMFHAQLRAQSESFRKRQHPNLQHMKGPYHALFHELHFRIHASDARGARDAGRPEAPVHAPPPYAPPLFEVLRDAFADELPAEHGPAHFLDDGLDALRQEVAEHTGGSVTLPERQPSPGSSWLAMLVRCAVCDMARVDVRAYRVDLTAEPALEVPLREGRINHATCPDCGSEVCYPLRTIAIDPPGARDDVAELTCVWRLTPRAIVYQPTPGAVRDERNDQILQIRFEWLLENEPSIEGVSRAVAYSLEELLELFGHFTAEDAVTQVPVGSLQEQLRSEVSSDLVSLSAAREIIFREVAKKGADWAFLQQEAEQRMDDPIEHVLGCWIDEAVAIAQSLSPAERIYLAHQTTWSLMAMGEVGLAEAALVRGEDLLAQCDSDEVRNHCAFLLGSPRAELLEIQSRPDEAIERREKLDLTGVITATRGRHAWHASNWRRARRGCSGRPVATGRRSTRTRTPSASSRRFSRSASSPSCRCALGAS